MKPEVPRVPVSVLAVPVPEAWVWEEAVFPSSSLLPSSSVLLLD